MLLGKEGFIFDCTWSSADAISLSLHSLMILTQFQTARYTLVETSLIVGKFMNTIINTKNQMVCTATRNRLHVFTQQYNRLNHLRGSSI